MLLFEEGEGEGEEDAKGDGAAIGPDITVNDIASTASPMAVAMADN